MLHPMCAVIALVAVSTVLLAMTVDGQPAAAPMELIILHNNDMHARFEQTDALSKECRQDDVLLSKCYGGFARIVYK